MFPGIDYIKTIVNGISSAVASLLKEMGTKLSKEIDKKIEVSKADWNQNDETQPDYITNRPFYTEMLEKSIEGIEIANIPPNVTFDENLPLEIGQVWNVSYKMVNGFIESSYYTNLEVQQAEDGTLYLGDYPDPIGYPFSITTTRIRSMSTWVSNAGVSSIILTGVSGTMHEEVVHQIPTKYIPADAFDNVLCVNLSMGEGGTITADKTFAEITEAAGSGMCVIARFPSGEMFYLTFYGDTFAVFFLNNGIEFVNIHCNSSDTWSFESHTLTASDVGAIPSPATAVAGQTIVVKAVDETGKPTEWEAADLPSGGSDKELTLLADINFEGNAASEFYYTGLDNVSEIYIVGGEIKSAMDNAVSSFSLRINDIEVATNAVLTIQKTSGIAAWNSYNIMRFNGAFWESLKSPEHTGSSETVHLNYARYSNSVVLDVGKAQKISLYVPDPAYKPVTGWMKIWVR